MKKTILIGMALTLGMNSISIASSSRVQEVQEKTAEGRTELRRDLVEDLRSAREDLDNLSKDLTAAQESHDEHKTATILGSIGVWAVGAMAVMYAFNRGPGSPSGRVVDVAFGSMAGISGIYAAVNGARLYTDSTVIDDIQKRIKDTNDQIAQLEQQISEQN